MDAMGTLGNKVPLKDHPDIEKRLVVLSQEDAGDAQARRRPRRIFRVLTCFLILGLWLYGRSIILDRATDLLALKETASIKTADCPHGHPRYSIPPHIELGECVNWASDDDVTSSSLPGTANAQLDFDISSGLTFVARGASLHGDFKLGQGHASHSEEIELKSNKAQVKVQVTYDDEKYLEDAVKVCRIINTVNNSTGLGIFTPKQRGRGHRHFTEFDVSVRLPSSSKHGLVIPYISSELANFKQTVALDEGTHIDNFVILGVNEGIKIESLGASNVNVTSVNGPIWAKLTANSSVNLANLNSPVVAELVLHNENADKPTIANIAASKSEITLITNLTSTEENGGGNFSINAAAARSQVSISVPEAPVGHALALKVSAVLDKVDVKLPSTYEGSFNLTTILSQTGLVWDETSEDPAGRGRIRHVDFSRQDRHGIHGVTWWGDEEGRAKAPGTVSLVSTLAEVKLAL